MSRIPDPLKSADRNWGKILNNIWNGIEARRPTVATRLTGDGALFEELYASVDAVKTPWRDPTRHVQKKYTDDEAEHLFFAVRGLMKNLATRCDAEGDPKA